MPILIVEDSRVQQLMYEVAFSNPEHTLHLAGNGLEGLRLLKAGAVRRDPAGSPHARDGRTGVHPRGAVEPEAPVSADYRCDD
jgi:hypothetical protein